ncbi:MAG: helix-turn-helix domain-containing protein [Bacteroidales bacterium]|jgi:excisionase family DNA binding protein|nr:helix-turn-helix domain-containing protein [Bacteroidales bacterium]
MDKTVFISLPIEDLQTVIIDCVNSCLKNNEQESKSTEQPEKLLTVKGAATYLDLSVPTVYSKCSRNEIPFMKRSKRLYFSSTELFLYLKEGRKLTNSEIEAESETYLTKRKGGRTNG